jgi:CubicO group peptidase (beta-lactamase class C family)
MARDLADAFICLLPQQRYARLMMRPATRTLAGIAVCLLEIAGAVHAGAADWSQEKSAKADTLVAHFLRPKRLDGNPRPPAVSIAIALDGKLVLAKGYGYARPGVPATEATVYHIGSLTKQFTAAAMLMAIEQEAVAPVSGTPVTLDTPMSAFFRGVERWTAADEPTITVRSLLNMTSNLPNFTRRPPPNVDPWGAVPAPRLLDELKKLAPTGWPHSFEYSNTSYFLLAQIIETVSRDGRGAGSFRDYVRAFVLERAGMTQTGFVGDYAPGSDLAMAHYRRRPAFEKPAWLHGCGDMASNALDLFAWNKALIEGRVLAPESLAAMFADGGRVSPATYYGMGWFVEHAEGWDSYSHSGSVPGFTSYNAIFRRQDSGAWLSVTLLTNSDGIEGLDDLALELFETARAE